MIKNLFYISIMLSTLLQVGCGKGVKNDSSSDDDSDIRSITSEVHKLEASLKIDGSSELSMKSFAEAREVRIPASIVVKNGNAGNNAAIIYFNANSDIDFDFYCKYIGGASVTSPENQEDVEKGLAYNFDDCYKALNDQRQINFYPGESITQKDESTVILELLSADPRFNTSAEAEIEEVLR